MRALLAFLLFSCGSGDKGNSDGDSGGGGGGAVDAAPGETALCMLDGDCAPGDACVGARPGVARSGRCEPRGDLGLAPECWAP